MIKVELYKLMMANLEEKIISCQTAIDAAEESRNNETKSSAGDKFETGRAMMQMERDKNEMQLMKLNDQKLQLTRINPKETFTQVELGSLVITKDNNLYFSIPLGKIVCKGESYFALTLASPLGQLLHRKEKGDEVIFQNKKIVIHDIF